MSGRTSLTELDDWQQRGQRFLYRGHAIFFAQSNASLPGEFGTQRETVLLIHGFPTASWDWSSIWPMLATRFNLIAPDLIGFGFSAKPADYDYCIHDQATMCEALLTHAGISEYHILAHDVGDTVAQELLARNTERESGLRPRLKSVCFLNGGLFPETHRPRMVQRLLLSPIGKWMAGKTTKEKFAANMLAISGAASPPTAAEIDGFWQLIMHNDGLQIFHKLIRYMRERRIFRDRWVGALEQTGAANTIPMRLINGAADPISGAHMAARYRELVPAADCILLNGIGHYPQVEAPALVADLFLNFHDTRVAVPDSRELKSSRRASP